MASPKFTRHAKNRMRWHKITKEDVELTIEKPEWIEEAKEGKVNAWRKVGPKFLRVTYKEEKDLIVVITAVFKKKRPHGGER